MGNAESRNEVFPTVTRRSHWRLFLSWRANAAPSPTSYTLAALWLSWRSTEFRRSLWTALGSRSSWAYSGLSPHCLVSSVALLATGAEGPSEAKGTMPTRTNTCVMSALGCDRQVYGLSHLSCLQGSFRSSFGLGSPPQASALPPLTAASNFHGAAAITDSVCFF